MGIEKSCVYKFIDRAEKSFEEGKSLEEVLSSIGRYQEVSKRFYGTNTGVLHTLISHRISLRAFTYYEFLRSRGLPAPSANSVVQPIWKFILMGNHLIFCGKRDIADRRNLFEFKLD